MKAAKIAFGLAVAALIILFFIVVADDEMLQIKNTVAVLEKPTPLIYADGNTKIGEIPKGRVKSFARIYGKDYLAFKVRYGDGYGYVIYDGRDVELFR